MFKSFWTTMLLLVATILLCFGMTWNSPLSAHELFSPQATTSPTPTVTETPTAKTSESLPQTTPQQMDEHPRSPDQAAVKSPDSRSSKLSSPYDIEAVKKFDDELYGS
jgi:hypothetical protein